MHKVPAHPMRGKGGGFANAIRDQMLKTQGLRSEMHFSVPTIHGPGQNALMHYLALQTANQILRPDKAVAEKPSLDKLKSLENELRESQVKSSVAQDSLNGGKNEPTQEMKEMQDKYPCARPMRQFEHEPNLLGDYSHLLKQLRGRQNSIADSFILSTLESKRPVHKIADDSGDGYSLLANTFMDDTKAFRKSTKIRKLNSSVLQL
jgi:hypothetical protein